MQSNINESLTWDINESLIWDKIQTHNNLQESIPNNFSNIPLQVRSETQSENSPAKLSPHNESSAKNIQFPTPEFYNTPSKSSQTTSRLTDIKTELKSFITSNTSFFEKSNSLINQSQSPTGQ